MTIRPDSLDIDHQSRWWRLRADAMLDSGILLRGDRSFDLQEQRLDVAIGIKRNHHLRRCFDTASLCLVGANHMLMLNNAKYWRNLRELLK